MISRHPSGRFCLVPPRLVWQPEEEISVVKSQTAWSKREKLVCISAIKKETVIISTALSSSILS
jgi:hypothetical protein